MRFIGRREIAVILAGVLIHTDVAVATEPPAVSSAAPVAVSTSVPTIQITPHNAKKPPENAKWSWKEWAIMIGSILTLGAVVAVGASQQSGSGSGSGSKMGM